MKKGLFILIVLIGWIAQAQTDSLAQDSIISLDPLSFTSKLPFTAKNVSGAELEERNLGQDLPMLLKNTPAVVSTSDAGAGIGYTGLRIRGSDQTRINVTMNGVPVNDSESHGVFWVNMPDLAASTNQIIIQRGLGTSTNGTAAFGASVNINTNQPKAKAFVQANLSAGSFNTFKHSLGVGSGTFAKNWSVEGRISHINSDGYVDRARSDLWSYNASVQYKKDNRKIWFTTFGGKEETYQSWFGIDENTLSTNRTFNPAGAILNDDGEIVDFYQDQVDDYHQDHYQLHYEDRFGDWKLKSALHYTYGRGYFEEYINQANLLDYELNEGTSDLVRRQWLNNHFYGGLFNLQRKFNQWNLLIGGTINRYDGDHFGRVIQVLNNPNHTKNEYYNNRGTKDERSFYIKGIYELGRFDFFADLQFRNIVYQTSAPTDGLNPTLENFVDLNESFNFWNPKAGITYSNPFGDLYFSYALGHREPNRTDFFDSGRIPQEETLHDFELGFRVNKEKFSFNANAYYMYYENQLVLTGALNDVGAPIRENSGESFRSGIELDANYQANSWLKLFGNIVLSINKNVDWQESINNQTVDFGNTNIAYSPNIIVNFGLEVQPIKGLTANLINKYVGEQYMSNAEFAQSKLDAYLIGDLLLRYELPKINGIEGVDFTLFVNNLFNQEFENNGFYFNFFDGNQSDSRGLNHNPFFYPQAGINFLAGLSIRL